MKTHDILRDAASRPGIEAAVAVKGLSAEALNAHPGGHPNSIAWLLWHAGRQMDMQLSALNGQPQVWEAQGFRERFNLGELGDTIGYGHTPRAGTLHRGCRFCPAGGVPCGNRRGARGLRADAERG